jgi:hypothetical protein
MESKDIMRQLCGLPIWLIGRKKKLVHSVIDSGASTNAISYALVRDIGYRINTRDKQEVHTGNGAVTMMGTITIPCNSGEYYLGNITFHVSKEDIPVLLGIGFLEDYSDSISFKRREMYIGGTCVPLVDFDGYSGCLKEESLDEDLIKKILTNIINNPREERFRKLSLASKALNEAQYATILYLQNIGFKEVSNKRVHVKNDGTKECVDEPRCLMFTGDVDDLRSLVY